MTVVATSQPSTDPKSGGDPAATPGTETQTTPPAKPAPAADEFDASKLTPDQLTKVLENKELWNLPRIKELREQAAEAKKLKDAADAASNDQLVKDKKFEELAKKNGDALAAANETIQTMKVNQALTNVLVKENVVDLDGALKLVDRAQISVDDNGNVAGVDDALKSLKEGKSYLFGSASGTPNVGTPSNPTSNPTGNGQYKFKESQITPEFYKEHEAELVAAAAQGLIEPDGPPR